ncbi:sushi, von Willebrand factor type A, EGF and pentraxin domain-containing protein 1-like isoform X2 [Dendronephthya gigantea]|nr:sushi, von Willebrand factor type A, EGF and pentraxin domain-containing protein 1-like isoform X2 [Dendronephthya gigantea]
MLHDVVYNTSAELQKNFSYDYIYFTTPQKEYNSNCVTEEGDFDLVFKQGQDVTLLGDNVPQMSKFTLMFWINIISKANKMKILSYVVDENAEGFSLTVWREMIILKLNSTKKVFHVPPINDGYWHHVGVSWYLGKYAFFLDGTLVYRGDDFGSSLPLKAGGVFVVGQKLKSTNGTSNHSSFVKLSQLNVWSEFISTAADVENKFTNQNCLNIEFGDVINWSSLKDSYGDMVVQEQPSSCKPLRKHPKYDIVITQSQDLLQTLKWGETLVQQIDAFTITTWVKYEKTPMDLDTAPLHHRYVDYTNASGTPLLLFYLTADNLTLEINGVEKRQKINFVIRYSFQKES